MSELKDAFWARMDDVRGAMLAIDDQDRFVAMSPQVDDDHPGFVWFITAEGTDLAKGVAAGPKAARLVVADGGAGLYADVRGTLQLSTNEDALDELWSFVSDAWFDGGQSDPDVRLLRFEPVQGEVSATPTSGIKFFYEIAKAHLTDETPEGGEQGQVTF